MRALGSHSFILAKNPFGPGGICLPSCWAPYCIWCHRAVAVDLLLCIIPSHRTNLPIICRLWPSLTLTKLTSMTTNPPCSHNPPLHLGTCHSNVPWRCQGVSSIALHVALWNSYSLPISQKTLRCKLWFSCCPPMCRSPAQVLRWEDLGYILWGGPLLLDFFLPCSFLWDFS